LLCKKRCFDTPLRHRQILCLAAALTKAGRARETSVPSKSIT